MKRIHIIGASSRTGTTLLLEVMKNCFDIDKYSEHEDRLFTRAKGSSKIFLTKFPKDAAIISPSLYLDPDLFVICMIRDPRDVICSIHHNVPNNYYVGLKYWKYFIHKIEKLQKHTRFISIKYEFFVSNPDEVQNMIMEKMPFLNKKKAFSKYHEEADISELSEKALNKIRPISPTSVGKWKNHKSRVAGQLVLHGQITDYLIKYEYEKNNDWLNVLKGHEPDLTRSHYSEFLSFYEKRLLNLGKYFEAFHRIIEQLIGRRIRITHPKKWF